MSTNHVWRIDMARLGPGRFSGRFFGRAARPFPMRWAHLCQALTQTLAHYPQMDQCKLRVQLRRVLGQSAIAHLHMATLALDEAEWVSDFGLYAGLDALNLFSQMALPLIAAHGKQPSHEQVEQHLSVMKTQEAVEAQVDGFSKQYATTASPKQMEQINLYLNSVMGWPAVKDEYTKLVQEAFTDEELRASLNFMKSPIGQSIARKNLVFSSKASMLIAKRAQAFTQQASKSAQQDRDEPPNPPMRLKQWMWNGTTKRTAPTSQGAWSTEATPWHEAFKWRSTSSWARSLLISTRPMSQAPSRPGASGISRWAVGARMPHPLSMTASGHRWCRPIEHVHPAAGLISRVQGVL